MSPLAYINGQWLPSDQLRLPVDDLGFVLGATVVERLRTFRGHAFRLDQHLSRLGRSLEIVGWDAVGLVTQVRQAVGEFLERNRGAIDAADDWTLTAFVTPGRTADAAQPTVCVWGSPLPFADFAEKFEAGVELVIVDVRQVPANCWPPELKCRSRMHYYLADAQARAREPGARALVLDQEGYVGEASTANVVAYYADRGLVHPPVHKVLPGVSQGMLFDLADNLGLDRTESDLTPAELIGADEVFLTSTSVCVQPVVRIDAQPVGSGMPGPVYRQLLAAWSEQVGVDIAGQAQRYWQRST